MSTNNVRQKREKLKVDKWIGLPSFGNEAEGLDTFFIILEGIIREPLRVVIRLLFRQQ